MAIVKLTCPDCGDFEAVPTDVTVVADMTERLRHLYRFICPIDKSLVIKEADNKTVKSLLEIDSKLEVYESPHVEAEFENQREISEKFGSITDDEQIDFHIHMIGHEALALIALQELNA